MMVGPESVGDEPRVGEFAVVLVGEPDRKCLYRAGACPCHHRHDGAGIDPAAQKSPEWDVTDQVQPNGFVEQLPQVRDEVVLAASVVWLKPDVPVPLEVGLSSLPRDEDVAGFELSDSLEN